MATSIPPESRAQVNGVFQDDEKKGARVHSFDPNASPEQKASAAGKGSDNLKSVKDDGGQGGRAVAIDAGGVKGITPTITIDDVDKQALDAPKTPKSATDPQVPGELREGGGPVIPDWYRAGWREVGSAGLPPMEEGEARDKGIIDQYLGEQYYGAWYHNAAIIFFAVFSSHFLTVFHRGWGWLFIVLATCATYYSTSMERVRRRARDDIQRELVKNRLMSEHESAEWINTFMERFWLIYEPVLSRTVIASVDQVLSSNTPAFLESIRLTEFTLGTKAPRIDKVRTHPRTADDIVMMDWGFSFTPNDVSDITPRQAALKVNPKVILGIRVGKGLATAGMPILLEDMSFTGFLRVRLKLMTNFPHVQVVDISFLEKPVFDYVLRPVGGETFGFDIGNIPGLSAFIRDQVHANLGPMMYDPNVFTLNLEQLLSGAPLDAAIGVLQITVHSARGIKGSKIGGGTPDPYVSLSINQRGELDRTKYKQSTYNPSWSETKFLLINNITEHLALTVLDYNEHRKDSELGTATFELSKLQEDATQEGLIGTILKDGKERGELRYDVSFYPVLKPEKVDGNKEEKMPESSVGIARVTIHQAKDLDASKTMFGDLNPLAQVFLAGSTKPILQTKPFKHTLSPVFEAPIEFLCADRASSMLTVKVLDDRDFHKDSTVGHMTVRLEDILEAQKEAGRDWWPLSGCKTGRVRVSVEWKPLNMAGSLQGVDQYIPPIGVVRLWVKKATDVKNVEATLGGKSDPYLRVLVNNVVEARTEVINNNLNPAWDAILYIPVHSPRELLLLECMDYQHMTKDRSLGSIELRVSELAEQSGDNKFPYASNGKIEKTEPLRLDSNVYKGQLNFVAEFVPAMKLKGIKFESTGNEIQRAASGPKGDSDGFTVASSSSSSSSDEEEPAPNVATVRKPINAGHTKNVKSTDTAASVQTAETSPVSPTGGANEAQAAPDEGVELSREELLKHQSGIIIFNVVSGELQKKARLEVLLDDGYWPAFSTVKARSTNAQWDHVGEGFIKELDFGRVWLRLNENNEGDKDDIIAEFKCDAKAFLQACLDGPQKFTLKDQDERKSSVVEIEARYLPVEIKLEPRESINNQGQLRIELLDGKEMHGADRSGAFSSVMKQVMSEGPTGKSDPYVVFTLNEQKVFKSQTKKKTLTPEWNENFVVNVPSRVGASFELEVFDWNQLEQAKSLGIGKIELADIEPFEAVERTIALSHHKHGEKGSVRLRMNFQPELIAKSRKNTSTFSHAGRAVTQIGGLPIGAGKGVAHGVGHGVGKVAGVFKRDHAKENSIDEVAEPSAGQASLPVGVADGAAFPGANTASDKAVLPNEPGTLRVTVMSAKDLAGHHGDSVKPYVVVRCGDKKQKTKNVGKTHTPEWNESFAFTAGPDQPLLHVEIYDDKLIGKDKPIGEADIEIWKHIQTSGQTSADIWAELREGQGLLRLRLEFDANGGSLPRGASMSSLDRPGLGSPSRFSLRQKPN